ncbi:unnamed protein product [Ilex paraguariensis]|uniref:Reverse transcriptase domain-containing protein n=1 Tax=Ilex paraguariensis TaxID=185542 RepID=A0ABC8RCY3_9AQUA
MDYSLKVQERQLLASQSNAARNEESFFKQKSRVLWLKEGDKNTAYFFQTMTKRRNRKKILSLQTENGVTIEGDITVKREIVEFYQQLLGSKSPTSSGQARKRILFCMVHPKLNEQQSKDMIREVSADEIREVFLEAWPVIGGDVIGAIREFFSTGNMLREFNNTIITLVPKVQNPTTMGEFRPISCYNVIYKAISQIIANRIKKYLNGIINPSQSAFIPGRRISDNILLAQEIMRDYHKERGSPRCTVKVDIMKACDTIDWQFIIDTLEAFNLPARMKSWIWSCIAFPKFSVNINGELEGFFPSARGLRQGDPLSPYLFVLAMEVLSLSTNQRINSNAQFKFHWRCKKLKLCQLTFADDLLMFCHGDIQSATTLKEALNQFPWLSGLQVNPKKSSLFMAAVDPQDTKQIIDLFDFPKGNLPIRYLGIPLISTRMRTIHCLPLIKIIESRVKSWTNRFLSYARRMQLITFVLGSIHIFWSSHLTSASFG